MHANDVMHFIAVVFIWHLACLTILWFIYEQTFLLFFPLSQAGCSPVKHPFQNGVCAIISALVDFQMHSFRLPASCPTALLSQSTSGANSVFAQTLLTRTVTLGSVKCLPPSFTDAGVIYNCSIKSKLFAVLITFWFFSLSSTGIRAGCITLGRPCVQRD